jgi:hypothetical protein
MLKSFLGIALSDPERPDGIITLIRSRFEEIRKKGTEDLTTKGTKTTKAGRKDHIPIFSLRSFLGALCVLCGE